MGICTVIVIIIVIIVIIAAASRRGRREWESFEDDVSREWSELEDESRGRLRRERGRSRSSRRERSRHSESRDESRFEDSRRISSRIHFLDESKSDCSPAIHKIRDTVRFRRHESRPCSESSSSSSDSSCTKSSSSESSDCGCTKCRRESYSPRSSSDSSSSISWKKADHGSGRCRKCNTFRKMVEGGTTCACTCVCTSSVYNFNLFPTVTFTQLGTSQVIGASNLGPKITAYGYTNAGVATTLSSRGNQDADEQGMGIWDDQFSNAVPASSIHELDNQHFIQLDVSALKSYYYNQCGQPTITIGSVQQGEGYALYGSNTQGTLGTKLYSFVGTTTSEVAMTVNLFDPANTGAPQQYQFISVQAYPQGAVTAGGDVVIVNVTVNSCQ
jgi:hypothetical protein